MTHTLTRFATLLVALVARLYAADSTGTMLADSTFFESKIRPLLVEKCFQCHSEQSKKHKGGLSVDSVAALLKGGESGAALVPGKPEQSKIVEAITYKNADLQMPPKGKLSAVQIADLTEWVKRGAPWPNASTVSAPTASALPPLDLEKKKRMAEHWAWQPVKSQTPPTIKNALWPINSIDVFILAKLEEKNLEPAPPADKRTLIRRATFDLTGLPPSVEDVDAFLKDTSPGAYAKLIDRLLATPQYGERWARHWLDMARYADSNGMDENLAYANAYRYRDYVVNAFNKDLPYDQYVREQIAGDLMPVTTDRDETLRRQTATAFLALGPKVLAEPDPKKMEMDIVDEELDTTGRTFMGLTLGCCRCHDHKFDPFPTSDYYAMAAIFKGTRIMEGFNKVARWYERPLGSPEEIAKRDAVDAQIKKNKAEIDGINKAENERLLASFRKDCAAYMLAAADVLRTPPAQDKPRNANDVATAKKLNVTILNKWIEYLKKDDAERRAIFSPWNELRKLPPNDFVPGAAAFAQRIKENGGDKSIKLNPHVAEIFSPIPPASLDDLAQRYAHLFADSQVSFQKLKATPAGKAVKKLPDDAHEALRQVLADAKNGPFVLPEKTETFYSAEAVSKIKSIHDATVGLEKTRPTFGDAMGATEGEHLASLRIHIRGNPQTLGEPVLKHFPAILSDASPSLEPLSEKQSGRLEFANWLTRARHPLTARVMVNRLWRWHFGSGIVNSPDNFGLLGEKPSHPELLDWLATDFVSHGWSMKHLHRQIMLSSTYQMSVTVNEKYTRIDPENRLHWRMNRQRLEAEVLRDGVLSVSGEIDLTMGGSILTTKNRDYINNDAIRPLYDIKRRSIYLPVMRNNVYDVFQAFDFPDPNIVNGSRATTTVAPQALFMLNGKLVLDASQKLAQLLMDRKDLDDAGRVKLAYEKAFSRPPTQVESDRALDFVRRYSDALLKLEKPPAANELKARAWAGFCQVIFASNEFVYVE